MSILELGAAEESYLPTNINFRRHVGIGLNGKLMDENPSLTEKLIVNLNNVIEEKGVDSDELKMLATDPFDAVIMANRSEMGGNLLLAQFNRFKHTWRDTAFLDQKGLLRQIRASANQSLARLQ